MISNFQDRSYHNYKVKCANFMKSTNENSKNEMIGIMAFIHIKVSIGKIEMIAIKSK
jgi:hypothetical protein